MRSVGRAHGRRTVWAMTGSLRQRGPDTWELRVYLGVDHDSGRERWATKTVHGSRRHATARLGEFVEDAGYARLRAGTVADLLDRWMGQASSGWSSTTLAQTRSIVEHHLKPLLGDIRVNKLTTIGHRRHVQLVVAMWRARRPAAEPGHGAPRPRRVASSVDPGRAVRVDLAQLGSQRKSAPRHACRDSPSDTRLDSTACRIG